MEFVSVKAWPLGKDWFRKGLAETLLLSSAPECVTLRSIWRAFAPSRGIS